MIYPAWLNQIGDRNPQLLREWRGRLQVRSFLVTLGLVVLAEVLFAASYINRLPGPDRAYSSFCLNGDYSPNCLIDWSKWWLSMFRDLNWLMPFAIFLPGIYGLITDINQEQQRGTLNFLRLSPRSSQNILLGKLLGVPSLLYIALLVAFPLHAYVALHVPNGLGFLISYYAVFGLTGAVLFTAALFIGFSGRGGQNTPMAWVSGNALAGLALAGAFVIPSLWTWNSVTVWNFFPQFLTTWNDGPASRIDWFTIPINRNPFLATLFTLSNLAIVTFLIWRILQRSFRNPKTTLISKRQSYGIVGYAAVLMVGFAMQSDYVTGKLSQDYWLGIMGLLISTMTFGFLPLLLSLSIPRQMALDWLQVRKAISLQHREQTGRWPSPWRKAAISDLIWGDKSPGITAIAINLLLVSIAFFLPLSFVETFDRFRAFVGLGLGVALVLIYGLIVQWMLLLQTPKRTIWAVGSLSFAVLFPPLAALILAIGDGESLVAKFLMLFSPGFWAILSTDRSLSSGLGMIAVIVQWILIIGLGNALWLRYRQLSRALQHSDSV
ncbi:hypothetical protein ACN4EG_16415 [Alkalinema pantanalense CENA528]|uniref:hypothetical protein n=1 Tax=Alkalinema pantanalense TaxID=1620705 RepID=UPI003D6DE7AA